MKVSKSELPSLILFVKIRRNIPTIRNTIAPKINISDKNKGIPWPAKYSTEPEKFLSLVVTELTNIALINNLPKKFKELNLLRFIIFLYC